MKILVVYYSLEGNTDYIAQMIARKCGAVLERLRPENEPPKNALRYIIGGREAIRNEKARLNTTVYDPEAYDVIVVGSPVWAGRMTPAVREYLVSHPFEGKKTAIFACSASGKADRTIDGIRTLMAGNEVIGTASFRHPLRYSNKAEIQVNRFLEETGLAAAQKK